MFRAWTPTDDKSEASKDFLRLLSRRWRLTNWIFVTDDWHMDSAVVAIVVTAYMHGIHMRPALLHTHAHARDWTDLTTLNKFLSNWIIWCIPILRTNYIKHQFNLTRKLLICRWSNHMYAVLKDYTQLNF